MVSNFVGREKERPSLTPDDFDIENQPPIVVSYLILCIFPSILTTVENTGKRS